MSVSKMSPTSMELEGRNLGEKHRNYNKLVQQAIASKTAVEPGDLNSGENDVEHLMTIDIAAKNRDVEYILKVLKCEDMMYVSRAIKQSKWLTEKRYAHIINPNYLDTHLFPEMTVNAKNELMKHLRLDLKDEERADQFADYESKSNIKNAAKWLPNCSKKFILSKGFYLLKSKDCGLFNRICEKVPDMLQILLKDDARFIKERLQSVSYLLHSAPEKYLHVVEKLNEYNIPKFGARTTELLMQKFPNRIIDKFETYCNHIHVPTFVQYLEKTEIKYFLFSQGKKNSYILGYFFREPKNVNYFLDAMTAEQRSEFLDEVFINKIHSEEDDKEGSGKYGVRKLFLYMTYFNSEYIYYDFNTAFDKITKGIRSSSSQEDKEKLLELLVKCSARDSRNVQTVLKYYHEKHAKDTLKTTENFLKHLLPQINIAKLDSECWSILDTIFKRLEVYSVVPGCVETIIVSKIIRGENIPKEIEEEFMKKYSTLKKYQDSLINEQKEKVFKYLYDRITQKVQNNEITNETEFKKGIEDLKLVLTLLIDSKKELSDFPWVLDKTREYLKMKKDHSWKSSMTCVYNAKKSWRRLMFEESIELCPSETVCLNLLKHNDQLLSLEKDEVDALRCNNKVSLHRLLKKIRTYWPNTLATEWTQQYQNSLNKQGRHKAAVRGLCALLPRQQLLQLIHNYAPKQAKIDYKESGEISLDVQRELAKNMLIARPRPPPDAVLLYAKGDFLQYALPSLLAIFNNANLGQTRNFITKLLSAPVSLQKHGIRIAFAKLKPKEALTMFHDIWMSTTNATIRAVVFQFTYSLLDKDETLQNDIWEILFLFIGNLTQEEDKTIYKIISKHENLDMMPQNLRAEYLMTTYRFLNELIPKLPEKEQSHYEWKASKLFERTKDFMECFHTTFIWDTLSKFIENEFMKKSLSFHGSSEKTRIMTAFVLCSKGDKIQMERYNQFLLPLLQRCISSWDQMNFIPYNVNQLLNGLRYDLKNYVLVQGMDIPLTMFEDIEKQLNLLSVPDNYIMLMKWKFTVELTRLLKRKGVVNKSWNDTCVNLAPEFGIKCLEYLKADVTSYFPCIYLHFSKALTIFFEGMIPSDAMIIIYRSILRDAQFIQGYLSVIKMFRRENSDDDTKDLMKRLREHPSMEVQMHYTHKFKVEA